MGFLLFLLMQSTGLLVLDNPYAQVIKNGAPCAKSGTAGCGDRVIVALSPVELPMAGSVLKLARGEIAVYEAKDSYAPPTSGNYLEVTFKPKHPPVKSPPEMIAPEMNSVLYDGPRFFVFEEKLEPGEQRPRHSHRQRVVVVINSTRLQQWPDGEAMLFKDQIPDDVHFNEPVVHIVKNVGQKPLRNIVIELKP